MKCMSPENLYCKGTSRGILNSFTYRDMPVTEHEYPQQWLKQCHRRGSVQEQNRINENEELREK